MIFFYSIIDGIRILYMSAVKSVCVTPISSSGSDNHGSNYRWLINVLNKLKMKETIFYVLLAVALVLFLALFCYYSTSYQFDIVLIAVVITIVLLATGIIMEYLAVLLFMASMILLGIAPSHVVFSGFTSGGFWLIFAGMILSMALKVTGLADRLSNVLQRVFQGSYSNLVIGMVCFGALMAFIMPSATGRVVLMLPITIDFARANGFKAGSKGYSGLVIAGVFATYIAGFAILPSNLPNIILMGAIKSLYHHELSYAHYLWLNFPVLGLLKLLLLTFVVIKIFKEEPTKEQTAEKTKHSKVSFVEKRLMFYLVIVLIAWLSDSVIKLSPAWPALGMAVVCLLPGIGIIDHKQFFKNAKIEPLFYVGGLIGLSAVVSYIGLGNLLGNKMLAMLPLTPGHDAVNFYLLSLLSIVTGTLTTLPGVPAIMTPLSGSMAHSTHLPLMTVLMIQVVGFSTFVLPYQAPPILVALRISGLSLGTVSKMCLLMLVLSLIVLLPLDYYWWKFLGVF